MVESESTIKYRTRCNFLVCTHQMVDNLASVVTASNLISCNEWHLVWISIPTKQIQSLFTYICVLSLYL